MRALIVAALLLSLSACLGGGSIRPDPKNDATRREIVLDALGQVGRPYRYGGTTPSGFDCSGLVQYVFAQSGVKLPRTTRQQHADGRVVDMDDAVPGDLLFYSFSGHGIDHVAIYLGDDEAVHAPATGRNVIVASVHLKFWRQHFVDAVRVLP
ncbi:C40 family peptidase [Solimonas marina]|uniref:C40 family peptidase n=1 Tax=Solimonas marina TaxID=2714601 RepID=A0A969WAP4_9GAMM|nr:C40 family peptidase [Solimonas marina]NKF22548.1 C40 family peptidase [Solimonas marina]